MRTLEDKILKYPPDDARNPFRLFRSPLRIEFENRAIMDFIGFDDAGKVQGGEYDVVFFNEVVREQSQEASIGFDGNDGGWVGWQSCCER